MFIEKNHWKRPLGGKSENNTKTDLENLVLMMPEDCAHLQIHGDYVNEPLRSTLERLFIE
jgi:hypothetical protein